MSDRDLRSVARDLEHHIVPPDFDVIAARGRRLRRRRRALQAAAGSSALAAALAVGVALGQVPGRAPAPDPTPAREDRSGVAADVLSDPRAVVDDAATAVSDTGAVLQRVRVPTADTCARADSAWVWTPWDGAARAWSDKRGGRTAVAVSGGFAVSAPAADCSGRRSTQEPGAYVVDGDGRRTEIRWLGRSEQVCAAAPAAGRCAVDVADGTGRLLDQPGAERPDVSTFPVSSSGPVRWARSVDSRTVHWSTDAGATWRRHRTSLPTTGDVQVTAAGDWAVFFSYPDAEFTRDGGATWQRWNGERPLGPFLVANELVAVSADGDLVVVSHRPGGPPQVLASTDDRWRHFRRADVRTEFGTVSPQAAGAWLWVVDQGRTWVSPDGLSWRAVEPHRR